MLAQHRANNVRRSVGVLLRIPKREDPTLLVVLVAEHEGALTTGL